MKNKTAYELIKESKRKKSDFMRYSYNAGYSQISYVGSYTEDFERLLGRVPTEDDIISVIDSDSYNFGGYCNINTEERTYSGKVYID